MPAPRIPPVALTLITAALMWLTAWLVPALAFAMPGSRVVAVFLALIGILTAISGVVSFRRAATTVNPLRPETASSLVVSGIYRFTRNPMYLGLLFVLLGWAVFLSNAVAFVWLAAFVPYMNSFQIGAEEAALATLFGQEFTNYRARVRRWL
jgi:protein-S-isoprenylcysteine O-methyltransferase Ste14